MQKESSKKAGGSTETAGGARIELALPVTETDLFKHGAATHVLNFLADNPDFEVSIRQLTNVVPYTERSVREAVDTLEAAGLVTTSRDGPARRVHINRARLATDDPVLSVPQPEFHLPVRLATLAVMDKLDEVRGVVLFGSVARGEADRQSDIDLWVLVGNDRAVNQHRANELAQTLSALRIPQTVTLSEVTGDIDPDWNELRSLLEDRQDQFSGDRYGFELVVETPTSFLSALDRVEEDIFREGITLRDSETLQRVKQEVLDRE